MNEPAERDQDRDVDGDALLAARLQGDAQRLAAATPPMLRQRIMARIRVEEFASVRNHGSDGAGSAPAPSFAPRWRMYAAAASLALFALAAAIFASRASQQQDSAGGAPGAVIAQDQRATGNTNEPLAPAERARPPLAALESLIDPAAGAAMAEGMMQPLRDELGRLASTGDRMIRSALDVLPPGMGPGR